MENLVNTSTSILLLSTNPTIPNTASVGYIQLPPYAANFNSSLQMKNTKRKRGSSRVLFEENQVNAAFSEHDDVAKVLFSDDEDHTHSRTKKSCANDLSMSSMQFETSMTAPNILKRNKRKNTSFCDDSLLATDLDFSPSKFLNLTPLSTSLNTTCSQDVSFSSPTKTSTQVELDSGIAMTSVDMDDDSFVMPSLTSTPIGSNSRKQILEPSRLMEELGSPELKYSSFSVNEIDMTSTCDTNENGIKCGSSGSTNFKTPLIKRYLNEITPRTPTPFKCDSASKKKPITPTTKTVQRLQENLVLDSMHPRKLLEKMNLEVSSKKSKRALINKSHKDGKTMEHKKARKALLQDPEWNSYHHKPVTTVDELATKLPPQNGFQALESPFTKSQMKVRRLSGLIDNNIFVSQRTNSILHKSVFYTSHTSSKTNSFVLNEHARLNKSWVTVACGKSKDQRDMTDAAKRCLGVFPHKLNKCLADVVCQKKASLMNYR